MKEMLRSEKVLVPGTLLVSLLVFHLIFSKFYPNANLRLGHDYSYFLPMLLNGFYWYEANGIFQIPWFTPAFCGGLPFFANPQGMFYSVPQFLTFFFNPLTSIYLTLLLFAAIGFTGFYLLLRRCFHAPLDASVFGAVLFMFNGFFVHRLLIGHFTYHSFMLIPLIAYLLLKTRRPNVETGRLDVIIDTLCAAALTAYFIYAGGANFIVPAMLSVIGIAMIHRLATGERTRFVARLACAGVISIGLSLAKLSAALSYLGQFPRSLYTLPGIPGFGQTIRYVTELLFFRSAIARGPDLVTNFPFLIEPHEFEFSLTVVPLLAIAAWAAIRLREHFKGNIPIEFPRLGRRWLIAIALAVLMILPAALNTYGPEWSVFLKTLPYIRNTSSMLRWIAINVPLVVLISAVAVAAIRNADVRHSLAILGILFLFFLNGTYQRTYYHAQAYRPAAVVNAYDRVRETGEVPPVKSITANPTGGTVPNDSLVRGQSRLDCYEPLFGYRREQFPLHDLRPGPVMAERNGRLNIKNPACYLFGDENNCAAGDHFLTIENPLAEKFVAYKPFPFAMPLRQKIANFVSMGTLVAVLAIVLGGIGYRARLSK